ncbi:MAG: ParB/RepB/Spo0J family partition protein [Deltaproteobacteria bacterium]|nr:ParB/RepB/Spo0J family partition protein [Deltaproteobacteria bacterium]
MAKKFQFRLDPLNLAQNVDLFSKNVGYREIPIDLLVLDESQPRKQFDESALENLAKSIQEVGILSPILVEEIAGGKFKVIAGERRTRAAKIAGLRSIPAVVKDFSSGSAYQKLVSQLVENIQREDLNPLDRARAIFELKNNFNLSVREIAEKIGISKSQVQRSLEILNLAPEYQKLLVEGVSESKVLEIAKLKDFANKPDKATSLLKHNRDQLRNLRQASPEFSKLSEICSALFGVPVLIRVTRKKCSVTVTFDSVKTAITVFETFQKN